MFLPLKPNTKMIEWGDIYQVVVGMMPLYVALILGYGSVKWWRLFEPSQCDAVNRLVYYFTLPLFSFEFTAHSDPFGWNYKFIAADCISKAVILAVIVLWSRFSTKGSYSWYITTYSLSTLTNTLIIGVPIIKPMYGSKGKDLVVQSAIFQSIVWCAILLFVLEFRRARTGGLEDTGAEVDEDGNGMKGNDGAVDQKKKASLWWTMKVVSLKVARNPNCYACFVGVVWAAVANRWNLQMPSIIDKSVQIMSNAGAGTAMLSMGMFMGIQEKLIACGPGLTIFGMILKFIAGPAAMAIGSLAVGLRSDALCISIIQAALPQAVNSFVFAKEYGLHADVISTAVIFGTLMSLPVLIAYYAALEFVH